MWEIRPPFVTPWRYRPRVPRERGSRLLCSPLGEHRNTLSSPSLSSSFETRALALYGSCQNYVSESKPEISLLSGDRDSRYTRHRHPKNKCASKRKLKTCHRCTMNREIHWRFCNSDRLSKFERNCPLNEIPWCTFGYDRLCSLQLEASTERWRQPSRIHTTFNGTIF